MIYLKYNDFTTSNIIPKKEKIIGTKKSNNFDYRIFSLPKMFDELDLSEPEFIFMLQIQPINKDEKAYFQTLEKIILDDTIELRWIINNTNTKSEGVLGVSIKAQREENNIIWESSILEFSVLDGIDAIEELSEIPANIMEQYVIQAAGYSEKSIEAANLIYEMYQDILKKHDNILEKYNDILNKYDEIIGLNET